MRILRSRSVTRPRVLSLVEMADMTINSSPVSVLDLPAFSDAPFQTAVKQASYVTPNKPRGAVIAAPPLRVLRVCCGFVDSYAHFELQIARADELEYSLIRSHADVLSLCRLLGCEPPPEARELPIFLNGLIAECEAHTLLEALHDTVPVALPESLATAAPAIVPAVLHTGFWVLHLKTLLVRWFLDGMQHFVERAPCPTLASAGSGLTRHVTIDLFFEINKRTLERRRGAAAQHLQASWRGLLARRSCAQALEAAVNEPLPDPSPTTRGRGGAFAIAVVSILLRSTTLSGNSTMHACNTSEVCNAQPAVGPNHSTDIEVTVSTCASTYAPMQRACARLRRRTSSDDNASLVDVVPFTDACEAVKRACGE